KLFFCQYFLRILDLASSTDDMIAGNSDSYAVISESKREFSLSKELLVLPAFVVIEYTHAWEPLGEGVYIVFVFREIFKATAIHEHHIAVFFLGTPVDAENELFACFERGRKIDTQHGVIDDVGKSFSF